MRPEIKLRVEAVPELDPVRFAVFAICLLAASINEKAQVISSIILYTSSISRKPIVDSCLGS